MVILALTILFDAKFGHVLHQQQPTDHRAVTANISNATSYTKWRRDVSTPYRRQGPPLEAPLEAHAGDDAEEQAYQNALCKGEKLIQAMNGTNAEAAGIFKQGDSAESKFLTFSDWHADCSTCELEKWGYGTIDYNPYFDFDLSVPIERALDGLGVSSKKTTEGGSNQAWYCAHHRETRHDGKKYPPTGGSYTTIFNLSDGVIISCGAFSPANMGGKQRPPVTIFPELAKLSDIIFLQWKQLHSRKGSSTRHLRYVLSTPCENSTTQIVIGKAMEKTRKELKKWPGEEFSMDSDQGKAILGTPNGFGVGFMLIQHKRQLGNKVIDKAIVFQDEGRKHPRPPSIVFFIKDA